MSSQFTLIHQSYKYAAKEKSKISLGHKLILICTDMKKFEHQVNLFSENFLSNRSVSIWCDLDFQFPTESFHSQLIR